MTAASNEQPVVEVYRLSARDRSGLFMGLGLPQLALLGTGVIVGSVSAMVRGPAIFMLPLSAAVIVLSLVPYRGRPFVEQVGALASYVLDTVTTRRRWTARLDLLGRTEGHAQLPASMGGLVLREVDGEHSPKAAVVEDRHEGTLSASMRVTGRRFALASESEQDRMLEEWAQALAPLCRREGPVVGLTWAEWTAPTRIEAHRAWMARSFDPRADPEALSAYEEVLALTGAHTARHEVIVTLSVSIARAVRRGARRGPLSAAARLDAAAGVLLRELSLLGGRLSSGGLEASAPLRAPELARALRDRLDPSAIGRLDEYSRSLGDVAGVVSPGNAGPLASEVGRSYWRTDATLHRAFAVTEWPRTGVYADWLASFLLDVGGVRSTAVCYRPVSPVESARRIAHQSTQLESDEQIKRDKGYLVSGEHRRNKENLSKREQQLLDGHVEFSYCGIVVVSAPDLEALDEQCEQVVQSAARCRMELRSLDFQHDRAVTCTLPLGRLPKQAAL